jgi:hypothetical protein
VDGSRRCEHDGIYAHYAPDLSGGARFIERAFGEGPKRRSPAQDARG